MNKSGVSAYRKFQPPPCGLFYERLSCYFFIYFFFISVILVMFTVVGM